jgi:hypothetical protein
VALWRGGRDGAVMALTVSAQFVVGWAIEGVDPIWLWAVMDVLTLALGLFLVLTGRSYWMILVAASQVLTVATNAMWFAFKLTPWSYYSAQRAWSLALFATLLVGPLLWPSRPKGRPQP